jgi:hypothetical protein
LSGIAISRERRIFRLAPMCAVMRASTLALLALPPFLAVALARVPVPWVREAVVCGVVLLYLSVWLWWRPSHFRLDPAELTIHWPLRHARIPWSTIREVREISRSKLRHELGASARVGAGGLWGGFGWLWSARRGLLDLYVSRLDGWVVIERHGARPLILTPANPAEFADAVRAGAGDALGTKS